eukprot:1512761-Prymnesium_polylepis.2
MHWEACRTVGRVASDRHELGGRISATEGRGSRVGERWSQHFGQTRTNVLLAKARFQRRVAGHISQTCATSPGQGWAPAARWAHLLPDVDHLLPNMALIWS